MGDDDLGPEVQVAGPSPQASGSWSGWGPTVPCRDLPIPQGWTGSASGPRYHHGTNLWSGNSLWSVHRAAQP